MSQDPRNIFVNNRSGYTEQTQDSSSQHNTTGTGSAGTSQARNSTTQGDATNQYTTNNGQTNNSSIGNQTVEQRIKQMQALADKYQREGEGQLIKDIVSNVITEKAKGNLTNQQLITFANRVMPLLNSDQKTRLQGLLDELLKL